MRILIFSLTYHPFIGGAEVAIKEITDRNSDIDFDMITVNLDGKQKATEQIGNIMVHRMGRGKLSKYFFPFTAQRFAKKLQTKKKFNATWAMMANQAGLAASWFRKANSEVPFLLTLQEGDSEFDIWIRTWWMRPMYKMIYRRADRIQSISNFLTKRAKKMGATCKIDTISNGVDFEKVDDARGHGKHMREKLGVKDDETLIITTSRLEKKNANDILIQSIVSLKKFYPNIKAKLVICGTGELEGSLKALIQKLGLNNEVMMLGFVPHSEMYGYLDGSDVFARPSRSEGFGNSFIESMAMGVPTIGTPVGGIIDFLHHEKTGIVCKVDDPNDLAKKIALIVNDTDLRNRISDKGEKLVREKYSWNHIGEQMKEVFEGLLSKNGIRI